MTRRCNVDQSCHHLEPVPALPWVPLPATSRDCQLLWLASMVVFVMLVVVLVVAVLVLFMPAYVGGCQSPFIQVVRLPRDASDFHERGPHVTTFLGGLASLTHSVRQRHCAVII